MRRTFLVALGAALALLAVDRLAFAGGYGGGGAASTGTVTFVGDTMTPSGAALSVNAAASMSAPGGYCFEATCQAFVTGNGTGTALEIDFKDSLAAGDANASFHFRSRNIRTAGALLDVFNAGNGAVFTVGALATQITPAAATTGSGFRNGSTRTITRNSSVAVADCAAGTLNLTVTQFLDSGFATCGSAQTINFPTWQGASGIVQGLPGTPAVGDVVEFTVVSTAAANVTVGAGTGGTISGNAVLNNTRATFHCRLTNVTATTESATCY